MPRPPEGGARAGLSLLLAPRRRKPAGPQADALTPFAKKVCGKLAETLAARCGLKAGFAPTEEPLDPEPGPGLALTLTGADGRARIAVGQSALYDLIEALFGGDGSAPAYREERRPSELERALAAGLGPIFADAFGAALGREDIRFERVALAPEPEPDEVACALTMRLVGRDTRLAIACPRRWLGLGETPQETPTAAGGGAPALDDLSLDLAVALRERGRALEDVIGLRVGDTLALSPGAANAIEIDCEGAPLFRAALGQSGGRYTVRLGRRLACAPAPLVPPQEFSR